MKTVNITPAVGFANGKRHVATQLHVVSVADNLFHKVVFRYTLLDENNQHAGEGSYTLEGFEAYSAWDASADGAYIIVAAGLQLEILPVLAGKSMFVEV